MAQAMLKLDDHAVLVTIAEAQRCHQRNLQMAQQWKLRQARD